MIAIALQDIGPVYDVPLSYLHGRSYTQTSLQGNNGSNPASDARECCMRTSSCKVLELYRIKGQI